MKVIVKMQTLGYTFCYLQKSLPIFHLETGSKTFQSLLSHQFTNFNLPPTPRKCSRQVHLPFPRLLGLRCEKFKCIYSATRPVSDKSRLNCNNEDFPSHELAWLLCCKTFGYAHSEAKQKQLHQMQTRKREAEPYMYLSVQLFWELWNTYLLC